MKNFKNFEMAYASLVRAQKALYGFSTSKVTEHFVSDFQFTRNSVKSGMDEALRYLRGWLTKNFPRTAADAYHSDQFSFAEFFAMLKKYPELAEENKEALAELLSSLKTSDLAPTGLKKVPELSEFVK